MHKTLFIFLYLLGCCATVANAQEPQIKSSGKLILVRHGQSTWNRQNRFTGWTDVPLTQRGCQQALRAADQLKDMRIDVAYTSRLKRASHSLDLIMGKIGRPPKVIADQALNERHYGLLQGLNKKWTARILGRKRVHKWRRSYEGKPPFGESLKMTAQRTIPFYNQHIARDLRDGKNVLVVAHGNSLRSIIMHLEKLSPSQVPGLNLSTGVPIIYQLDNHGQILSKQVRDWKSARP